MAHQITRPFERLTAVSNPESFIDEVTEEVRRDRLFAIFRKYGWIGVVIVLGVVGGTAYNEWSKSKDAARAQARTSGTPIVWRATAQGFEFIGASPRRDASESLTEPRAWLVPGTAVQVVEPAGNLRELVLGPEPLGPSQRLSLTLADQRLELASNGLRAFAPTGGLAAP